MRLINELSPQIAAEATDITPKTLSPEKGHGSVRFAAGYGEQNNRRYLDLDFRPAFHDLLDYPQGYIDGAAINVFDTRLKWFEGNNLKLESLSFIDVTSLSPLSSWRNPVSWFFDLRLDRSQLNETRSVRSFVSKGGVGVSMKQQSFTPFILLTGEWNLASSYSQGYSLLLGGQLGLHFNYAASQFMLSYEKADAMAGFDLDKAVAEVQWQYNFQVDHAMRLHYKRTDYDFFEDEDWVLGYHYYF